MKRTIEVCGITALLIASLATRPPVARAAAPFPGQRGGWHGFDRHDFTVDGRSVVVVAPRVAAPGRPWVWHAEFLGTPAEPEIALLGRGFHVVHMKTPDLFGSPRAIAHWDALYKVLTEQHGLAKKAALFGTSRGGLYCYNWAAAFPDRVTCIVGDAPVCDLASWPAGKGKGTGNKNEMPKLMKVYGAATEAEALTKATNPIDQLAPLARARIPLLHVYGDADKGVPWDENTGIVAERYRKLGGEITLIAKPGVGHVHGLDDSTPVVDFIVCHAMPCAAAEKPRVIGDRRELFVDRYLIERLSDARLVLHAPRDEGKVLGMDKPWEGPHAGYSTVLKDGDRYLLYYRAIAKLTRDGSEHERTAVAFSRDGILWVKPELGLFEFEGSKANNLVLANAAPVTHNFCPMLDARPGVAADERFKAVGGTDKGLFAYVSADGLRWRKLRDTPILTTQHMPFRHIHLFDSQNLAFWSPTEKCYVCYFRVWDGLRRIARSTSSDFVQWTPAVLMKHIHDDGVSRRPAPDEHLYTNQTSPYFRAPHLMIATPARFMPDRQVLTEAQARALNVHPDFFKDTSDAIFLTTRGGDTYERTFLEAFLRPGIGARNWVSRTNYPTLNVVPTGPAEMSLYVDHDNAQPTAHIRRYSLRLDGFASVRGGAEGELLTRPLTFSGDKLWLNFATSAAGGLRVEIQDAATGQPLPGFALANCRELIGNEIERAVEWKTGASVAGLAGRPVRLRIALHDADLYALRFGTSGEPR